MSQESVYKVKLGTGKTVVLRTMKIAYQELAAKAAAQRAGDNMQLLAIGMQSELIRLLIVSINDKVPEKIQLEKLDDLFSYEEYMQMQQVLAKVAGTGSLGEFQIEVATGGDK